MTFAVVCSLCFYFNWALFAYYPQVNEVHFSDLGASARVEELLPVRPCQA
jgi:hypothetical protein